MKLIRFFVWLWRLIWNRIFLSNFTPGVAVVLPLALTAAVIWLAGGWVASKVGPGTSIGGSLQALGLRFVADEGIATAVGWLAVTAVVCLIGAVARFVARSKARNLVDDIHRAIGNIPIVGFVHKPFSQVVQMLKKDGLKAMRPVSCGFGEAAFLALATSSETYMFRGKRCRLVLIPTSPTPLTGALMFVSEALVEPVEGMSIDDMLTMYISLGALAPKVLPESFLTD